ncbi:hypothetical protein QEJ31_01480 [Pigmentibacter sp. JX0631]|uniref:hypothetical protein n=1 Tax=Pigmentibacter sp. JX0631 TaxID=2976982 RepID=UPI002469AB3C|nr:hypothetical protein [Pigmentibacter sp. JX0631]WGL60276.1 hypothetical protein QEJ31_01480 [Pigmentibacter sp. JX0631]
MYISSKVRLSGWLLPNGTWSECLPWEHLKSAKNIPYVIENKENNAVLQTYWDHPDEELLRSELGKIGMIKISYTLIDADYINELQLTQLQKLAQIYPLEEELEFIGKIKLKIQVRIFLKIKDPQRLNNLF